MSEQTEEVEIQSGISGTRMEERDFKKKVGMFEFIPLIINPSKEQLEKLLNTTLKDELKPYVEHNSIYKRKIKDAEGNEIGEEEIPTTKATLIIWGYDLNTKLKIKIRMELYDTAFLKTDKKKRQYIDNAGNTTWSDTPENVIEWMQVRPLREAKVGEEALYSFLRSLLDINTMVVTNKIQVNWRNIMNGDFKELNDVISCEFAKDKKGQPRSVTCMATVSTKVKKDGEEGEIVEFQNVYNKKFLPGYCMRQFRIVDYTSKALQEKLRIRDKAKEKMKNYEKFVIEVTNPEFPLKDAYSLKELHDYDSSVNPVATNAVVIEDDNPDY